MYINPRDFYPQRLLIFIVYVQPFISIFSFMLLCLLHYLLWGKNFYHRYGFMSLYSTFEVTLLFSESLINAVIFFGGKDYIEFHWCYPYLAFTFTVPSALYFCCQWLRVAQATQRVLVVYLPMTYQRYFNRQNVVIGIIFVLIVAFSVSTVSIWFLNPKERLIIDTLNKKMVSVCIADIVQTNNDTNVINVAISIFIMISSDAIPIVSMSVLCLLLSRKIKKQNLFRRQFQTNRENLIERDRMIIVVTITTFLAVIASIPRIIEPLLGINSDVYFTSVDSLEVLAIVDKAIRVVSVPTTFILFGSLSAEFRNTCKKFIVCNK